MAGMFEEYCRPLMSGMFEEYCRPLMQHKHRGLGGVVVGRFG